jgi:hypothetical protein
LARWKQIEGEGGFVAASLPGVRHDVTKPYGIVVEDGEDFPYFMVLEDGEDVYPTLPYNAPPEE